MLMKYLTLNELCEELAISTATAKNWIKLGKIKPDFSVDYVKTLKKEIATGSKSYLKSRRNKKYVSGNSLYKDYVSKDSKNIETIANLLSKVNKLTKTEISFLIAECALRLMNNNLQKYLVSDDVNKLIEDLIGDRQKAQSFINNNPELFKFKYVYEAGEDILGLLYISLSNIGDRKSRGAYYTPTTVVKKLVKNLKISGNVIDSCCGTGNFLIQLPECIKPEQIYGSDIDEMSVKITRLNLFLKYKPKDTKIFYYNIRQEDFLYSDRKYDYIIGNPPWGSEFKPKEVKQLTSKYHSAVGYDMFVEKALDSLNKGGVLAFVLPEAILNVKTHKAIRDIINSKCELQSLEFLGNVFDGVYCPAVILQLQYTNKPMSYIGAEIKDCTRTFVINKERKQPNFLCDDKEYALLEKLHKDKLYLKDNAEFGLGIVTGNNKELLSNTKTLENEVIIKGSDIIKYGVTSANYIEFTPEKFQQVAPERLYRAKEKLLYRFIGNKLIFAYDNQQRLSLNSCNILIPRYDIKYILAVLNSRVAQFVFEKQYNSVKVLRSHIESIPIPRCNDKSEITALVEQLLQTPQDLDIYNILDEKIANLYGLTSQEYGLIKMVGVKKERQNLSF